MKKIILFLIFLILLMGGYFVYSWYYLDNIKKLTIEDEKININKLFIYGTHLNMSGEFSNGNNIDLVLYNGEFINFEVYKTDDNKFSLSSKINEGMYLDDIPVGKYYMFVRDTITSEDGNLLYKYYAINNQSGYNDTVYYTMGNFKNKIEIENDDDTYGTLMFDISSINEGNVYDIVIDPGHGGKDTGAIKNGYYESDITLKIATNLKHKLEKMGFAVKMTHEDGQLKSDEKLNDYGMNGRAVIPHKAHAKYLFSIHMNSSFDSFVNGIEIYAAANLNYNLANKLAKELVTNCNVNYSNNKINKVYDGVYSRTFTNSDIEKSKNDLISENLVPYDITTDTNYYYMIRETGGMITGAYVDDRNEEKKLSNPFVNTNVGVEAYLLELGYLSNKNDINNVINHIDKYTDTIANVFYEYVNM